MKKSVIITVIIALFSVIGANAQKTMDAFEIQVDGLGCPFCAYGLEKKFKEFKGIKKVKIDIESGDFSFEYPSEKALSMDDVKKQVEKAGYTPNEATITRANGKVETSGAESKMAMTSENLTTGSVYVFGNCGMCEARIIKAAKGVNGVANASWDKDSKILKLQYDPGMTSVADVEKTVVSVGHDSKSLKANAETYEGLPACCKYERVEQ